MNKIDFIKKEIFILTISGTFGHNSIYRSNVTEDGKTQFRNNIKLFLDKLESRYKSKITEEEHLLILDKLKKDIEKEGINVLKGSSISFGTVQKILNLYLKYLWCLEKTKKRGQVPFLKL